MKACLPFRNQVQEQWNPEVWETDKNHPIFGDIRFPLSIFLNVRGRFYPSDLFVFVSKFLVFQLTIEIPWEKFVIRTLTQNHLLFYSSPEPLMKSYLNCGIWSWKGSYLFLIRGRWEIPMETQAGTGFGEKIKQFFSSCHKWRMAWCYSLRSFS